MKKIILDYCYKLTFLSLYFVTLHPSETRVSKKEDWITFKNLVASGPNKFSEKREQKRRFQITGILNNYPEFTNNYIDTRDAIAVTIQNYDNYVMNLLLTTTKKNAVDILLPLILTAAHNQNLVALKKLKQKYSIKYSESVLEIDKNSGTTILHQALNANQPDLKLDELSVKTRRKKLLKELLKIENIESLLSVQDETGKTPLHLMASLGFDEEIKLYLEKIKDDKDTPLKLRDNHTYTVFDYALINNDMPLINFLIDFNPNLTHSRKTLKGDKKKLLSIIDGNPDKIGSYTQCALLLRCSKNFIYTALVNLLLDDDHDYINDGFYRNNSLLHKAIQQNDTVAFFYLIKKGAQIHDRWDPTESFLLHYAIENKSSFSIKEYLIKNIKNINIQETKNNDTVLHSAAKNNDLETVKALLNTDININIKNKDEMTALDIAEKNGFLEIAYHLLKCKTALPKIEVCDSSCSTEESCYKNEEKFLNEKFYCVVQ